MKLFLLLFLIIPAAVIAQYEEPEIINPEYLERSYVIKLDSNQSERNSQITLKDIKYEMEKSRMEDELTKSVLEIKSKRQDKESIVFSISYHTADSEIKSKLRVINYKDSLDLMFYQVNFNNVDTSVSYFLAEYYDWLVIPNINLVLTNLIPQSFFIEVKNELKKIDSVSIYKLDYSYMHGISSDTNFIKSDKQVLTEYDISLLEPVGMRNKDYFGPCLCEEDHLDYQIIPLNSALKAIEIYRDWDYYYLIIDYKGSKYNLSLRSENKDKFVTLIEASFN